MTSTIFNPLRPLLLGIMVTSVFSTSLQAEVLELISPENRLEIAPLEKQEYKWKHLPGAVQYAFSIRDSNLKQIIYNPRPFLKINASDYCLDGVCTFTTPDETTGMKDFGRYTWRVLAFNESGQRIGISRNIIFVSGEPPISPIITLPIENAITELPSKTAFQWMPTEGTPHYVFRLVDITSRERRRLIHREGKVPADVCTNDEATDAVLCSYELPSHIELEPGKYRFVVRSSNGYNRSIPSKVNFIVKPPVPQGILATGYDWSLPSYADENPNGGLVRDTTPAASKPESYTNTVFYSIRWYKENTGEESKEGEAFANFNGLDNLLTKLENEGKADKVLVRLEVNSLCDAPYGLRDDFNYYGGGSIAFWQESYMAQLEIFIKEFANRYANNPKIVGVHLGIADGEYKQIADALKFTDGTYENDYSTFCTEADQNPVLEKDGTYNFYTGDDGWGEFGIKEEELRNALDIEDGLTIAGIDESTGESDESAGNFNESVERIISIYTDAFNQNTDESEYDASIDFSSKLAMTNLESFAYKAWNSEGIVSDSIFEKLNTIKTTQITPYALGAGVGNRDGLIEDWMSYNNPVYGVGFVETGPDNTCKMTMDEGYAESYAERRYWGTENEEYGNFDWVIQRHGPYEAQPYRFMMSSLRALQMRRNHMQLNTEAMYDMITEGKDQLVSDYNTPGFLDYLAKTLGRKKTDTPDAFVVMGERYIRPEYIRGFSDPLDPDTPAATDAIVHPSIQALRNCAVQNSYNDKTSYLRIGEYGRWLTEVSGNGEKSNPISFSRNVEPWSIPQYLPEVIIETEAETETEGVRKYEYTARASNEFKFDINDAVVANRCQTGSECNLEVKVVFQDTVATTLSLVTEAGVVGRVATIGGGETKTSTFTVSGTFANGIEGIADFALVTSSETDTLPVFMTRVNFLSEPATDTPILAVVAAEQN